MHAPLALAALLVSAVVAKPIDKRVLVVETDFAVVVETVFVTADAAPATTTVDPVTTSAVAAEFTHIAWTHTAHSWKPKTTATNKATTTAAPVEPTTTAAAPTTTTEAATTSAASTPAPTTADSYQAAILLHHNLHRANHSSNALSWSDELASAAYDWASQCNYEHNTDVGDVAGGYGQNIAAGAPADQITNVITDMMYNGEMPYYADYYGDANPDFSNFDKFGHFTQIVWANTVSVGCATVQCSSLEGVGSDVSPIMTVCNYSPAGNMGGEYAANVLRPLGEATIYGTYGVTGDYS